MLRKITSPIFSVTELVT